MTITNRKGMNKTGKKVVELKDLDHQKVDDQEHKEGNKIQRRGSPRNGQPR
jgi:hypothetical protein